MIRIGKWTGNYRYADTDAGIVGGLARTKFDIEILTVNGNKFKENVTNDLAISGTVGARKIVGY